MEELYKSLIAGPDLLTEQISGELFGMTEPEGPVLILVDSERIYASNYPSRVGFLDESPELLEMICSQIDDGCDPCVHAVQNGCLVGTQLATQQSDCGYFLVFLPGYGADMVWANMDLVEFMLAQTQLIAQLTEKNNQLHTSQLSHMSRTSHVLNRC